MKNNCTRAKVVYPFRSVLGEGCLWDGDNQRLLWVDILDNKIYVYNPGIRSNTGFDFGQNISSVVITENGEWAYTDQDGVNFFNPQTGQIREGVKPEKDNCAIRFNEGKCDPRGTLWAGTISCDPGRETGNLYELTTSGEVKVKIEKTSISNGVAWSRNKLKFYFIDSLTYKIRQYDYDIETGNIFNERIVCNIEKKMGLPDGMAIDEEDYLWVALFGGGKVVRINPETGKIVYEVIVPAPKVTSCAFGGANLNELYITSATYLMTRAELKKFPLSGSLFKAEVPFKGVLPNKMKI